MKLSELLTPNEKIKWIWIVGFALIVSLFEAITASIIVIFAQVLNEPSAGHKYLHKIGFIEKLSPGQTIFYLSIVVGVVYLIKNSIASFEVFFQNFSIQKMCYDFKNKLLHRYAQSDYGFYLTRNSSFGLQVVGGDTEQAFSSGMSAFASILSETIIFVVLASVVIYMNPMLALIIFVIGALSYLLVTKLLLPKFYFWGQELQQAGISSSKNLMEFFHAFKEIILIGKKDSFVNAYKIH